MDDDARGLPLLQAINMIEHQDEIYARPARTWFQASDPVLQTACEILYVGALHTDVCGTFRLLVRQTVSI